MDIGWLAAGLRYQAARQQQEATMAREVRDSASLTKAEEKASGDAFPAFLKKKKGAKAGAAGAAKGKKAPPAFLKGGKK